MQQKTLDFENRAPDILQGEQNTNHSQGIASLIGTILSTVMVVALLILMYYLIMGAIGWITSSGDKGKMEEARNKITTALVGMILLASVLALVMFVQYVLGLDILKFNYSNTLFLPLIGT